MKSKKLLILFASIGLVLALVVLAVGGCAKPVEEVKESIKIGVSFDFSGVCALMGPVQRDSVKMATEEVNAAGGIFGRPIELFILDNGSDPAKSVATLKRFVELNRCVACISCGTSTTGIADKAWAEKNHIPVIATATMSDKLIHKEGKTWWFRTYTPGCEATGSILLRIKNLGYTKVAFAGTPLAWGTSMEANVEAACPKYGLDFVGSAFCEPKSKDLTIQARKLQDIGAEAIAMTEYSAEQCVWARAFNTIGWEPYVISSDEATTGEALGMGPPELFEGWETKSLVDRTKPYLWEVWDKYEAYTGERYDDEKVARAWDSAMLLFEAIRLSGDPDDPEAIRDGIYKIKDFPIALGHKRSTGSFEIGRNHLLTAEGITIYAIKSGKLEVVD